jgi:flagellar basal-body rod protein FlgG
MVAQQHNLDVIANNLANVNTTSFKEQRAEFQDLMYQTFKVGGASAGGTAVQPNSIQIGAGSQFSSDSSNFDPGPLQATGNPLDVAIAGSGFLSVLRPDGSTAYTRDGSLKTDASGLLVSSDGYPLQPEITIPQGATALSISNTGVVSAIRPGDSSPTELGRISLTMFSNPAGLLRVGQNLYTKTGASGDPTDADPGEQGSGLVNSGFLEGSNVQVVEEMVKMIMAQRAYEINSKAIQTADDMLAATNSIKR